ncbi:MAG: cation:proton antiporter [Planctomyces sp.]|nr:cation:proton antiporter [Planctomyces sp.]
MEPSSSMSFGWKGAFWYSIAIILAIAAFYGIRSAGSELTAPPPDSSALASTASDAIVGETKSSGAKPHVILHVTLTLAAVIAVGLLLGKLCRYIGQPPVIGEVIAGIFLGPSLLGALWPEGMQLLIPSAVSDPAGHVPAALHAISQLGVILYMFLVGLELNAAQLKGRASAAVAVSHASIVAPFLLGSVLSLWLYPRLSNSAVPFTSFALFMGVAMSVTAFPVLARILSDRGLDKTPLGVLALGCAAADDVTAWCLLAFVVGVATSQVQEGLMVALWSFVFISAMLFIVRPLLLRFVARLDARQKPLPPYAVSIVFLLVLLAAVCTEVVGIHGVFGAFLMGAVVPHNSRVAHEFSEKLKDMVGVLLLPAFFAYTGMRTQIGLVSGLDHWVMCFVIILTAVAGKFGGTLIAGRLVRQSWTTSAALGILMNTRGLMELIVLNIGLDLGVISPTLFAMMVLMALATTVMTSPALVWLLRRDSSGSIQL